MKPRTVLAISWQESGWQQRRRSSAGAIGAMQIMPGTGRWMSLYVGRKLNIYSLHDNVVAGVLLFKVLRGQTSKKRAIGGYYQGLGSIQQRGMYPSTTSVCPQREGDQPDAARAAGTPPDATPTGPPGPGSRPPPPRIER